eukprot:CAMPEP_0117050724 /NCGR_PEP_ID=MMETSP0472-20121206/35021_1 /TAXON_ID=693140 ORGANISM="Tiarina fusus, Strain LIS" /NCGR_SAMPLE_ID=MMETSP0472 /ASSEMBLY_ACC=CAM_ASM_000603 /LENGTH=390 /DNA_ID=CAMNT_0004764613 /DNA_START=101 /DNA_END=1273 /DNA_ORIENTATION=+
MKLQSPFHILAIVAYTANLLASSTDAAALEVGKKICVEGFVMDFFCINRGTLLDRPSVKTLEQPGVHSVHCLIDVGSCVNSPFEVLIDPPAAAGSSSGGLYTRGWRMTQETQNMVIAEAKAVGRCSDCQNVGSLNQGFRAAFEATIVDLGTDDIPATIEATRVVNSNDVADACSELIGMPNVLDTVDGSVFAIEGTGSNLRAKHLAHGSLMMIGWGLLLPSGAIIAKFLKHRPDGLWFRIHVPLQIFGLLLTVIGWIIALKNFDVFGDNGYNNYRHGIMGSTVMVAGLLQPLNAFLRPHPPSGGEEKSTLRLLWEIVHKSLGWGAILLAVATISLGTTILPMLDDQKTYQLAYGIGCGGCLLLLIVYVCVDRANYNEKPEPEQAAPKEQP